MEKEFVIGGMLKNLLAKTPQQLTDEEKAQILANLGITPEPGSLDGAVLYNAIQVLSAAQKKKARENIGAMSEAELSLYAKINGYYSQLTAGAAENLVGGNETSREFTEDTAGGTADIADGIVKIEKIKGNTIVWNQLEVMQTAENSSIGYSSSKKFWSTGVVKDSLHFNEDDSVITYSFDSNNSFFRGHSSARIVGHKYLVVLKAKSNTNKLNLTDGTTSVYHSGSGDWETLYILKAYEGTSVPNISIRLQFETTFPQEISHTQWRTFDLTKMFGTGNEPSTVAEFEKMFTLDFYNYNAGQLLSLNPTGIKTVGFNAYNPTTGKASVIGGKQYQITGAYTSIAEGDTTITPDSDGLFTPTHNGELTITGGNSTTTCVHLVWSGVRNGEYEEHWEETSNIPIAQINTDGTITESAVGKTRLFPDGLCSVGGSFDEVSPKKAIKRIGARAYEEGDNEDTSVLTDGTTTLYVLETPIEVTFAEPINLTYSVSDLGTETLLPVNGSEPATAQIKMDVVYGLNVVDFVRNADKNFVTIEDGTGDNGSTFTNLRSALSTAFGIDILPTFDATNKRYTFAITDNRKVEVPASATASGKTGTWAEDETAMYFCTDTNVWVKLSKTAW